MNLDCKQCLSLFYGTVVKILLELTLTELESHEKRLRLRRQRGPERDGKTAQH